jgi:23S rRNA (uracil1939-C5)-methyltransferase
MNRTEDSAVYSDNFKHLFGEEKLKVNIMGVSIELLPEAFMQVNTQIMQKIYKRIMELIGSLDNRTVIDLYSGIGITSLFFARAGAEVVSIELERAAVDEARRLARINKLNSRIRALQGDCAALLPDIINNLSDRESVVFLDPPRRGADPEVLRAILRANPEKILYLSCNPETLARDLKTLISGGGYTISSIEPYDMFPETPHVETLVSLKRN